MSHVDSSATAVYPSHLRSEIFDFDGVLATERLGELSHDNQLPLFRLNAVLNRPCTARFSLPDPSIDSSRIMEEVVSTGVERKFVKCIQRLRSGVVEITSARKADCDLILSKAAIPSPRRPSFLVAQPELHSPSSQHQHCTDEAQKAETVRFSASFAFCRFLTRSDAI